MKTSALFRKVAPSIWSKPGDPTVYGSFDLDVSGLRDRGLILPIFVCALCRTMNQNPMMSAMVGRGRVRHRKDRSLSVMVNIPGREDDLSALHLDAETEPGIESIREMIDRKSEMIRERRDPHLGTLLRLVEILPHFLVRLFVSLYSFLIYDLQTTLGLRFIPLRPFGSVIVSNIGSLGLSRAFLPLVPLARSSVMLAIGEAGPEVKVHQGKIEIREIIEIGVSFDHRLFDGSHAARMLKTFRREFEETFAAVLSSQGTDSGLRPKPSGPSEG